MKRQRNIDEKKHLARVAALPCMVSDHNCAGDVQCHHLIGGIDTTNAGMAGRASDYEVIPLCMNHHTGLLGAKHGEAVHKGTVSFEKNYGSQARMLERTYRLLGLDIKDFYKNFKVYNVKNNKKY